jgi:hypothetical protein
MLVLRAFVCGELEARGWLPDDAAARRFATAPLTKRSLRSILKRAELDGLLGVTWSVDLSYTHSRDLQNVHAAVGTHARARASEALAEAWLAADTDALCELVDPCPRSRARVVGAAASHALACAVTAGLVRSVSARACARALAAVDAWTDRREDLRVVQEIVVGVWGRLDGAAPPFYWEDRSPVELTDAAVQNATRAACRVVLRTGLVSTGAVDAAAIAAGCCGGREIDGRRVGGDSRFVRARDHWRVRAAHVFRTAVGCPSIEEHLGLVDDPDARPGAP